METLRGFVCRRSVFRAFVDVPFLAKFTQMKQPLDIPRLAAFSESSFMLAHSLLRPRGHVVFLCCHL